MLFTTLYFFRVLVITRFPLYLYMIGWINTYQSVQLTYVNKRFSFDAIFPQKWCSFSLIYFSFMSNNEEKGELFLKFLACYLLVIRTKLKKLPGQENFNNGLVIKMNYSVIFIADNNEKIRKIAYFELLQSRFEEYLACLINL